MNLVIGNSAGVFSGLTCQLAWMLVAENPNNELNLQLHTINKTSAWGNHFLDYEPSGRTYLESSSCDNYEEVLGENVLLKFFKESVKEYPSYLKFGGKGCHKEQFSDLDSLKVVVESLNRQWNKLEFTNKFAKLAKKEESLIFGKKVLSIMLRTTPHYIDPRTNRPLTDPNYVMECAIESVRNKIDDYDSVLVITQIQPFIDRFVQEFGSKCIFTETQRLKTDADWKGGRSDAHYQMTDKEYELEYQNVLLDVLLASKTDHILGSTSNMFMGALIMNPNITFGSIEKLSDFGGA